jgi:addiction module HigA family antidote
MITNFKSRETELIFQCRISLKYPRSIQVNALRKLRIIDAATSIGDLQILGCLEKLSSGSDNYSLAIDNRWRIQFTWIQPEEATEVDIVGDFGMGSRRNRLPNVHPGAVLQADLMQPLGLSIDRLSTESGVNRDTLLGILEGRLHIDVTIAARFASYFGNSQGFWQNLQRQFDSAQSSTTSATSETSYANTSGSILDRLQDIFHRDNNDFDELDDEPPSRYKRRADVFDTARLDDDIERHDTRSIGRSYRYSDFGDRERDVESRRSSPRPLSDFNVIEVDGKLSISIDELIAAGIIFNDKL